MSWQPMMQMSLQHIAAQNWLMCFFSLVVCMGRLMFEYILLVHLEIIRIVAPWCLLTTVTCKLWPKHDKNSHPQGSEFGPRPLKG